MKPLVARLQIRRLICTCLTRFYMHGDMLSIYARVSALQSTLSGKDPGQSIKPISDVGGSGLGLGRMQRAVGPAVLRHLAA